MNCTVITDQNNVVKAVALIPGDVRIPSNWHLYFPVTDGSRLQVGDVFVPDLDKMPWLRPEAAL